MAEKDPTPTAPPDDVEGIVDEVAQGFTDLLPPELLEEARQFALDALAAHPLGAQLAERVRPREVSRSEEQDVAATSDGNPVGARKVGGDAG